ncbi:hypothetical protein EG68_00070 [Paragonimus skrjabini miyazakii]|uniref:Uncharacterized protein n=1 Tax=Paragonimus skrjabini miyazakii TaxID=59628 RepID=A0A8S9ZCX1_9TREM|nr:hypothetical protein EG68_00070 [Paragonimus skrjabini miyazakii]
MNKTAKIHSDAKQLGLNFYLQPMVYHVLLHIQDVPHSLSFITHLLRRIFLLRYSEILHNNYAFMKIGRRSFQVVRL